METDNYNYHYPHTLKAIWDQAVDSYTKGGRNVNMFFDGADLEFLRGIGATPQEVYDFVEDFCDGAEPSWETFLLIQSVRRDYFLNVQHGNFSDTVINVDELPDKSEAVRGMEWLPRLIGKAKAKLRGEMPATLMFCCGGDRRFFKNHDIHPADFLRAAWAYENDDDALIEWTAAHSRQLQAHA